MNKLLTILEAYRNGERDLPGYAELMEIAQAEARGDELVAPRAFRMPEPGTPWWQTAKDCGAWTDRKDGDVGYVHFGSVEALRVYTMKVCRQAEAAALASQPMSRERVSEDRIADGLKEATDIPTIYEKMAFKKGVRFAERAHGIGSGSGSGSGASHA